MRPLGHWPPRRHAYGMARHKAPIAVKTKHRLKGKKVMIVRRAAIAAAVVVLVVGLVVANVRRHPRPEPPVQEKVWTEPVVNRAAPPLTLTELGTDREVHLSDLRGKPTVLIFANCT